MKKPPPPWVEELLIRVLFLISGSDSKIEKTPPLSARLLEKLLPSISEGKSAAPVMATAPPLKPATLLETSLLLTVALELARKIAPPPPVEMLSLIVLSIMIGDES
jgi:hypothetical protein